MSADRKFWENVAQKYSERPVRDKAAYDKTIERIKAHLNKDDRVLEFGCGTGTTALRLASDAAHITASDISQNMVEIARAKAKEQNVDNVAFVRAEASEDAFTDAPFDVVMAFHLLHLVEDAPSAIARMRALVKPGGLFISKTVCLGEGHNMMRIPIFFMRLVGRAPRVRFLKPGELEDMVRAEGFEILETADYPAKPPCRFIVARAPA